MGLSIFQQIKDIDQALFYQINGVWHHPILDAVLPWTRHSNNWIPLYIGLLGWLIYQVGWKTLKWLLFALINVGLTDQISSSVFKPFFHRLRPCNDPALVGKTRLLLDHCSGGFSFGTIISRYNFWKSPIRGRVMFTPRCCIRMLWVISRI